MQIKSRIVSYTVPGIALVSAGEIAESINEKGDLLSAGSGNDQLYGSNRNDALLGGGGNDLLIGGGGNDTVYAGGGSDIVYADNYATASEGRCAA